MLKSQVVKISFKDLKERKKKCLGQDFDHDFGIRKFDTVNQFYVVQICFSPYKTNRLLLTSSKKETILRL